MAEVYSHLERFEFESKQDCLNLGNYFEKKSTWVTAGKGAYVKTKHLKADLPKAALDRKRPLICTNADGRAGRFRAFKFNFIPALRWAVYGSQTTGQHDL